MGETPDLLLFQMKRWRMKRWLAIGVLAATAAISSLGETPQSASGQSAAPASGAVSERRPLSLDQLPAEKRADVLMARGQYAAAIVAYQSGNLHSAVVWNSIGMAYHHLLALDQARKAYETALALNPRFAAASNNLAAVFYAQSDYRNAERWYKHALKHSKESAVIYCNLGTAYFAEAKYKQGVKAYRKAFSMDENVFSPADQTAVQGGSTREQRVAMNYYLAQTYAVAGKQSKAIEYLRKAMDEGFKDRKRLLEDKDFAALRTTPEFQHLLEQENLN